MLFGPVMRLMQVFRYAFFSCTSISSFVLSVWNIRLSTAREERMEGAQTFTGWRHDPLDTPAIDPSLCLAKEWAYITSRDLAFLSGGQFYCTCPADFEAVLPTDSTPH